MTEEVSWVRDHRRCENTYMVNILKPKGRKETIVISNLCITEIILII
jgi:hypothetical protein